MRPRGVKNLIFDCKFKHVFATQLCFSQLLYLLVVSRITPSLSGNLIKKKIKR